jgi:hypothetical protein
MLKAAEYLDKALRAEESAKRATSPLLRESLADLARVWRELAASSFNVHNAYGPEHGRLAH